MECHSVIPCMVSACLMLCFPIYGIIGIALGIHAKQHPCNYNTRANVISCEPAEKLGDAYFHITYDDFRGQTHLGRIVSSVITCVMPISNNTYVDICYLAKDPSDFRNDKAFLKNPYGGDCLLATGIVCFAVFAILLCWVHCSKGLEYKVIGGGNDNNGSSNPTLLLGTTALMSHSHKSSLPTWSPA